MLEHNLPTPCLVLDGAMVRQNVQRLAAYAASHGISVRPHTKTHKSVELARLQLAAGAGGLTVAKVGEAYAMASAFDARPADIFMAYPAVDRHRTTRLAELARSASVQVAVDTEASLCAIGEAALAAGTTIGLLVDLDVGMGRTGVPTGQALVDLAHCVERTGGVRLDGIFYYPGQIWSLPQDQAVALAAVASKLQEAIDLFDRHGLCRTRVSGGSTPTAYQSHLVPQMTEIRPGTYIYNDMNTVRAGFCTLEQCAATIVCTVVSNAVTNQIILDGGSKTLTSDRCVPAPESGHGHIVEYPDATITKLSEEHGQVDVSRCQTRPQVGERVRVIPNHICPCINLQDAVWWRESGGIHRVTIDARGELS